MIIINEKYNKAKIIIAVSGGIDSMVLFDILKTSNIVVAHVNHNIRKESETEYDFLENLCKKNSIPFEGIKLEYSKDELKDNFQSVAREKRYNFFFSIMDKYSADYLALAHHGDDLVETVLMSISRGSSLKGYGGFKEESFLKGYRIIRPLLKYNSEDISYYAKTNDVKFYEDSSNKSDKYTRNRYRSEILPFLKKENNNIHHKYLQYSNTILDAHAYINEDVRTFLSKTFSVKAFNKLNRIVKKEVISNILSERKASINTSIIENIISVLLTKTPNQEVSLSNNLVLLKEYDSVTIIKRKVNQNLYLEINDFGEYELPDEKILIVSKKNSLNSLLKIKIFL